MSSSANTELAKSCEQILRRHQQREMQDFSCILCKQLLRGQDAVMDHLITTHGIYCTHFDDVADLDGFLGELSFRLHPNGGTAEAWHCPVCEEECIPAGLIGLETHVKANRDGEAHNQWNGETISTLTQFCVVVDDDDGDDSLNDCAVAAQSGALKARTDEEDGDDDWCAGDADEGWTEPCVCLFCDDTFDDCIRHMTEAHAFDLASTTRARKDVTEEYDLIRLVNEVRRCVARGECPAGSSTGASSSSECATDIKEKGSLEAHLLAHPTHRLPLGVPQGDAALIPALHGDALISLLVTEGEGFLPSETADPDFPMVPTIFELVAARKEAGKSS